MRRSRNALGIVIAVILAACRAPKVTVQVEQDAMGRLVLLVTDTDGRPSLEYDQLHVNACFTESIGNYQRWMIVRDSSRETIQDVVRTTYTYGETPRGWAERVRATPLAPGCYEASVRGKRGGGGQVQFNLDAKGSLRTKGDSPSPAAAPISGTYALNRSTGADTLILDPSGQYRHVYTIDGKRAAEAGEWNLIAGAENSRSVLLTEYTQWWGLEGDPDQRREKAERAATSELPVENWRAGRMVLQLTSDIGLHYERITGR
jgi:hypothetical protein